MTEIRFYGRFGQPVQKLARTIGKFALSQGKNVQVFDAFSAYRPEAPLFSNVRVANEYIRERSGNNTKPDVLVVLDNSLFGAADVTKGLKAGGTVMALNVEKEVLGDKASSFNFVKLDPFFQNGTDVEENIIKALKEHGLF